MSDDYLSVTEAAEKLAVSPRTIQRYCKQGRLNYKWVTGTRHRELRIIPPIPVSELPGVKKHGISPDEFISSEEFYRITESLTSQLREANDRLTTLRHEIEHLKSAGSQSGSNAMTAIPADQNTNELLRDFQTIRPLEKKLILKMAKEIQSHAQFLRTLGMTDQGNGDATN